VPTPLEWVRRLARDLEKQAKHARKYDAYYSGERELDIVKRDYLEVFGSAPETAARPDFDPPRTNVSAVGVNAVAERLQVEGFVIGQRRAADPEAAAESAEEAVDEAAEVWRRNDMGVMSAIGAAEALAKGAAFALIGVDGDGRAVLTVEDVEQMVVARQPVPPYDVAAAL